MGQTAIVLVEPDGFMGTGNKVAQYVPHWASSTDEDMEFMHMDAEDLGTSLFDITHVSRPLNGISVKPDTHAFVQVLREDGSPILVYNKLGEGLGEGGAYDPIMSGRHDARTIKHLMEDDPLGANKIINEGDHGYSDPSGNAALMRDRTGSADSTAWTDWILQSVREQRVEKTQVVETFGDTYLYAFGERPRAIEFRGVLLNTLDYNWRSVFWANWDRFFRATKLIEQNARMYIGWDDIIVEGYPLNAAAAESSDSPNAMTFQFTFFVTNYISIAAKKGFAAERAQKIATVMGGSYGGSGLTTAMAAGNDHRNQFIAWAGTYGATRLGGMLSDSMESATGEVFAQFTGRTVASLANMGLKASRKFMTGDAVGATFMNNYFRSLMYNTTRFWANKAISGIQDEAGWAPGEINAWFGQLGSIIKRMDHGSAAQEKQFKGHGNVPEGVSSNWLGDPEAKDQMSEALKTGSLDRILGAMAYAAVPEGAIGETYTSAYASQGLPAAITLVHMSPPGEAGKAPQFKNPFGK